MHDEAARVAQRGREPVEVGGHDDRPSVLRDRRAPVLRHDCGRALHARRRALRPGDFEAGRDRALGRRQRRVELVHPAQDVAELETAEDLLERRAIRRREHEGRRIEIDVEIAPHGGEQLRVARLICVLAQRPRPRRRQLVDMGQHFLERPESGDQLPGRLVADPGDARDVVRRVALEPDEVRHLLGREAVARLDALRRVHLDVGDPARRHHQADVLGAELERVPVGRDNAGLDARFVRTGGDGGDDVVRLPALELEIAIAERLDDRAKVGKLLAQQPGHRLALGLVLLRDLEPMHGPRVPRDGDAIRPVIDEQLEEHVDEAEQRVRREAVGGGELLGQRVVRPVGEVVAVDEEQLAVPRRPVVELKLSPGRGLRRHAATLRSTHPRAASSS